METITMARSTTADNMGTRIQWISYWIVKYKSEWVKEMQASFLVAAMILVFVSSIMAAHPLGGLWEDSTQPDKDPGCNIEFLKQVKEDYCYAGSPVLLYSKHDQFVEFTYYNIGCRISALVTIVAISIAVGTRGRGRRLALQVIEGTLCLSIFCLVHAILDCILLVMPKFALYPAWGWQSFILQGMLWVMGGFVGLTVIQFLAELYRIYGGQ